jgi:ABC-type phosphate transport system substrate-binding protein
MRLCYAITVGLISIALPVAQSAAAAPARGSVRGGTLHGTSARPFGKRPYYVRSRRPGVDPLSLLVLGGGSRTTAIAYSGVAAAQGAQPAVDQGVGSVLWYFQQHAPLPVNDGTNKPYAASYCQTGGGFGIDVMDGTVAQPNPCPALGSDFNGFLNAFDSPGSTDDADFADSDIPVTQAQYNAVAAEYPDHGELVQVPYLAASVAIAYHNSNVTSSATNGNRLRLTVADVCKIADGEITNWDQLPLATDPGQSNLPLTASPFNAVDAKTNPGFPSKSITFVYRSDRSGTNLSFTNFLSAAVGTIGPGTRTHCTGTGEGWGLNANFLSALPVFNGQNVTDFAAADGNSAVVRDVDAVDGAIGYVETANTLALTTNATYLANIYVVNSASFLKNPVADLPSSAKYIDLFKKDDVIVQTCGSGNSTIGCVGVGGRPIPDLRAATGVFKAGCLGIVDPASYAAPVLGYPIVTVANLEFYSSGNGIYAPALRYLADEMTNPATSWGPSSVTANSGITTVDREGTSVGQTGFSSLGINDSFFSNAYIGLLPNCIG